MIENRILNKCCSMILAIIVIVSMMMPSMLMPKEVSAATDTCYDVVVGNSGANMKGTSSLTPNTTAKWTTTFQMRNSKGNYLYCVDPFIFFKNGGVYSVSDILGHGNVTQDDLNYIAAGLDYIWSNYGSNTSLCYAYAQAFVWGSFSGKLTYSLSHFGLAGDYVTPVNTVTPVLEATYAYAQANKNKYLGNGKYYSKDGSQPLAMFGYVKQGYAKLKKITKSNKQLTDLCPEQYSLNGAEYGVYSDSGLKNLVGTLRTNESGDSNTIELVEGVYYAKETKAPKGYMLDTKVYTINVKSGETSTLNVADEPLFDPLSLKIQKKIEEGADKNISLEGAEYTVKYYKAFLNEEQTKTANPFRTWIFKTDKNGEIYIKTQYKIGGDELFKNDKGTPIGLKGTYTVEETKAPKGLAKTEGIVSLQQFTGEVVKGGTLEVMKDVTDIEKTQKVNIKIQKKDAETGDPKPQGYGSFAGAKFNVWLYDPLQLMDVLVGTIITNENGTGELVKLAPGLYTIEEIKAPAGYNKNPNKVKIEARVKELNTAYFDYLSTIAEKPITVTIDKTSIDEVGATVSVKGAVLALYNSKGEKIEEWTSDGDSHVFKGLAAGDYIIKEVRTPKGYLPLEEEYEFTVKEVEEIQKQEVFNEPMPEVNTIATFDTGTKESLPKEEVTVLDRFEYKKVLKGHPYEIRAKLVEKDNISNVIAEDNKEFTPESYSGEETLKFTFNAKELEEKKLVVMTELHRLDRKANTLVAVHKDINNIDETVVFPKIKTTATDKKDGDKKVPAAEKQTIVDKVSYTNLIIGRKYEVSGKLIDKETGKPIIVNGKEVTAEKEFTAKESNGFVNLDFTFNASNLGGKTVVVFEDLYHEGVLICMHRDINDINQSIDIIKRKTVKTGDNIGIIYYVLGTVLAGSILITLVLKRRYK